MSIDNFRVTSYYYVEVPVYIKISIYGTRGEIDSREIGGIVKVTKSGDKLYIWDIDNVLSLLDY